MHVHLVAQIWNYILDTSPVSYFPRSFPHFIFLPRVFILTFTHTSHVSFTFFFSAPSCLLAFAPFAVPCTWYVICVMSACALQFSDLLSSVAVTVRRELVDNIYIISTDNLLCDLCDEMLQLNDFPVE